MHSLYTECGRVCIAGHTPEVCAFAYQYAVEIQQTIPPWRTTEGCIFATVMSFNEAALPRTEIMRHLHVPLLGLRLGFSSDIRHANASPCMSTRVTIVMQCSRGMCGLLASAVHSGSASAAVDAIGLCLQRVHVSHPLHPPQNGWRRTSDMLVIADTTAHKSPEILEQSALSKKSANNRNTAQEIPEPPNP